MPEQTLPISFRIQHKNDFAKILSQGKKMRIDFFDLYYQENDLSGPRLGMVISKKKFPWRYSVIATSEC